MIKYKFDEEKFVALYFADLLNDYLAKEIIEKGEVDNSDEATNLAKFFWCMVEKSAEGTVELPCEGSSEFWTEKLYNSFGGYLQRAGYENEWDTEIDNA